MIHQLQSRKLPQYPNFTIGLISSKERAQQTNQEKPPVKESESNVKNDIVKQLDKHIKELFNKHLFQLKMGYEELSKARNKYHNEKIIFLKELVKKDEIIKHCVKSVRIWSFSGPDFPVFGLNTERCRGSLRVQSKCEKTRTRKTLNTDTFHAVLLSPVLSLKTDKHSNRLKSQKYTNINQPATKTK